MFVLEISKIENSINRVKSTMEIEGFTLSNGDLKILKKVAEGKLESDVLIKKYTDRVLKIMGSN